MYNRKEQEQIVELKPIPKKNNEETESSGELSDLKDSRDVEYFYDLGQHYQKLALTAKEPIQETYIFMTKNYYNQAGPVGQNALGLMYLQGSLVTKDQAQALAYFRLAADQGNCDGQCNLARCYEHGWGQEKDMENAVRLYKSLSDQGHAVAKYYLGLHYHEISAELHDLGLKLLQESAQLGNAEAQNYLGEYFQPKDSKQAISYYQSAIAQGHVDAHHGLGNCYEHGYGVEKDFKEAIRLYVLAANLGHEEAPESLARIYKEVEKNNGMVFATYQLYAEQNPRVAFRLAHCYESGIGTPLDEKLAIKWYRIAANAGLARAQFYLGNCYHEGRCGLEKDVNEAKNFYEKVAVQKNSLGALAAYTLAVIYDNEHQPHRLPPRIHHYYKIAAGQPIQHRAKALCRLGELLEKGDPPIEKDMKKAVSYYELAASLKDAEAQYHFAVCLEGGLGIKKDSKRALIYYELLAKQNHPGAQYALGLRYQLGKGVNEDIKEALRLYQLSADQQNPDAIYRLSCCYRAGIGVKQDETEADRLLQLAVKGEQPEAMCIKGDNYFQKVDRDIKQAARWYSASIDKKRNASALLGLAHCFRLGINEVPDYSSAMSLYKSAAELGSSEAYQYLGDFYLNGLGGEQDVSKAEQYYVTSWRLGNYKVANSLGLMYLEDMRIEDAKDWFNLARNHDDMNAIYNLALYRRPGEETYLELLQQAAALGHTKARSDLVEYFSAGHYLSDKKNTIKKALDYFMVAESKGEQFHAQIGHCYFYGGDGVEKDFEVAVRRYNLHQQIKQKELEQQQAQEEPEEQKKSEALVKNNLGYCYLHGLGVEKDVEKAKSLFRLARQFCINARTNLAYCFEKGIGVKIDINEAKRLYEAAWKCRDSEAGYRLGRWYETEGNLLKAKEYYLAAADEGNAKAQCHLGICLLKGSKMTVDHDKAVAYLKLSVVQGFKLAIVTLADCYKKGSGVEQDLHAAEALNNLIREGKEKKSTSFVKVSMAKMPAAFFNQRSLSPSSTTPPPSSGPMVSSSSSSSSSSSTSTSGVSIS